MSKPSTIFASGQSACCGPNLRTGPLSFECDRAKFAPQIGPAGAANMCVGGLIGVDRMFLNALKGDKRDNG